MDLGALAGRMIIKWNSVVVIDTGYGGNPWYDFGGPTRTQFKNALMGKVDPITLTTYPDFTNFPDDGYPRVGDQTQQHVFNKTAASPTTLQIDTYVAPIGTPSTTDGSFFYTIICPTIPQMEGVISSGSPQCCPPIGSQVLTNVISTPSCYPPTWGCILSKSDGTLLTSQYWTYNGNCYQTNANGNFIGVTPCTTTSTTTTSP